MRREDWQEIRNCVHTRVMLECEREYQEHLLLSVMPAYIAAEVEFSVMREDFKENKKTEFQRRFFYSVPQHICLTFLAKLEELHSYDEVHYNTMHSKL